MANAAPVFRSYRGRPTQWNPYFIAKRAFDVIVCLFLLPFLLPLMGLIALTIVLDSHGNPIFFQERIGRRGTRFRIVKFRTMKAGHDDSEDRAYMQAYIAGKIKRDDMGFCGHTYKPMNQADYTRVGRFLRRTSLDEIPQIFNILKGDMSLVGPRPNVPWEVEVYRLWHQSRLDALPGITGLAQINGRSTLTFDEIVRYDIQYVMNYSFGQDLKILWQTVGSTLLSMGAE